MNDPDAKLMLSFKAGNEKAFQLLFDKYSKKIINFCYRFCGQAEVAEELAQETFLKVYRGADKYQAEARFSTWLFRIATNVCLNETRKFKYRTNIESLDAPVTTSQGEVTKELEDKSIHTEAILEKQEMSKLIQQAMTELPEKQKAALLLKLNHDFSYREIGKQLNKSESGVKTLIHRGRNQLKNILQNYLKGD